MLKRAVQVLPIIISLTIGTVIARPAAATALYPDASSPIVSRTQINYYNSYIQAASSNQAPKQVPGPSPIMGLATIAGAAWLKRQREHRKSAIKRNYTWR
ncbi:MAG: hypothetical protein HC805_03305 [Alkalinema sp. RL_2_19]|nr:hypothetical protein [Alkalinema sp. RL_2_19]